MKTKIIAALFALVILTGCTAPTQKIAVQAMSIGMAQEATIVVDLATLAKQQALDAATAKVTAPGVDAATAKAAVTDLANTWEKISWLQLQNEKARSVLRVAQVYVFSQEGVFDILLREGGAAVDTVNAAGTTTTTTTTVVTTK